MLVMANTEFELGVTIKTTAKVHSALWRVIGTAKGFTSVRWKGRPINKESFVNAVWLWLDQEVDAKTLEDVMCRYVPKLAAILAELDPESTKKKQGAARVRKGKRGKGGDSRKEVG